MYGFSFWFVKCGIRGCGVLYVQQLCELSGENRGINPWAGEKAGVCSPFAVSREEGRIVEMRRYFVWICMLMVFLSGCQTPEREDSAETFALTEEEALFMTDGYLSDYDAQNQFSRYKDAAIVRDTIFFKCGSILYFFDMQTERAAPLCGKPECTHTGSTCNAYFWDLCGFCYYNEKLQVDRLAAVFIISV